MTVRSRLLAFAAAVAVAFAAGYGLGGAVEPVLDDDHQSPPTTLQHEEHEP